MRCRTISQNRIRILAQPHMAPRHLDECLLTALVVQLLEAIEAVARIAHDLAGLADVAGLLGKLQHADLGADDLLVFGYGVVLVRQFESMCRTDNQRKHQMSD